jgi:branched-subunit amino acid aminotransferase/4-amino-4-deoxychorismate lyase
MQIYIDGAFYPESEAKISVFDHGLLYGDGVFEGIRFYNGKVFRLEEHIERLYKSAAAHGSENCGDENFFHLAHPFSPPTPKIGVYQGWIMAHGEKPL